MIRSSTYLIINNFIIQVVFPLQKKLPDNLIEGSPKCKNEYPMFWGLVLENRKRETPLMVAIDNNHSK